MSRVEDVAPGELVVNNFLRTFVTKAKHRTETHHHIAKLLLCSKQRTDKCTRLVYICVHLACLGLAQGLERAFHQGRML